MAEEKVNRALIPYFGDKIPKKAQERTLKRLKKGSKLYLLHIIDEAPTRSIRYRTGQIGEKSELIKTFRKTQREVQEEAAREYAEEVKEEAAKQGISTEALYTSGDPAKEVLEAIDKYSIELVVVEKLRERLFELFLGDEIDYLCRKAPCEVLTVS